MDPFRFCLAIAPLAIYFVLLAVLNLLRRPFLTTGSRDTAVLGLALSGFIIIGPIELFAPARQAAYWGPYVWLFWTLTLVFAMLVLLLTVLMQRPRLVIYNISAETFRPVIAGVIESLDPDARWAGSSLVMPRLKIQLHMGCAPAMRNVTLTATNDEQSHAGWRKLEQALDEALAEVEVRPNARGVGFALVATAMFVLVTLELVSHTQTITASFRDMLRL